MNNKQSKPSKLAISLFVFFMVSGIYFMLGFSYLSVHEGIWGILQNLSFLSICFFLPIGAYLCYKQIKTGNETLWEDFSDVMGVIIFACLFFMFFEEMTTELYHTLFEKQKTVISDEYRFYYILHRGHKIYYLVFDDKHNPSPCNPKYSQCRYTYKVRVNGKTYDDLQHFNSSTTDNPLQLTFKPKANILMNLEILSNH